MKTMITDKNGKEIVLEDYEANTGVGVDIGCMRHRLWVCIDGAAVLRVKAPEIHLQDLRESREELRNDVQKLSDLLNDGECSCDALAPDDQPCVVCESQHLIASIKDNF